MPVCLYSFYRRPTCEACKKVFKTLSGTARWCEDCRPIFAPQSKKEQRHKPASRKARERRRMKELGGGNSEKKKGDPGGNWSRLAPPPTQSRSRGM